MNSVASSNLTLLVVAAGPGVSGSVARRFALEGYDVALLGADEAQLEALAAELRDGGTTVHAALADLTQEDASRAAITGLCELLGGVDVLHFNPSAFREADPLELSVEDLLTDVRLGVGGLLVALQAAHPFLRDGARITVTGSMAADQPWNRAASLGVQKAGVRNLVKSIDTTLAPKARATSITVRGALAAEGPFSPARVAESIWAAARQGEDDWQTEVVHAPRD